MLYFLNVNVIEFRVKSLLFIAFIKKMQINIDSKIKQFNYSCLNINPSLCNSQEFVDKNIHKIM